MRILQGHPSFYVAGAVALLAAGGMLALGHGTGATTVLAIVLFVIGAACITLASAKPQPQTNGALSIGITGLLVLGIALGTYGFYELNPGNTHEAHSDASEEPTLQMLGSYATRFDLSGSFERTGTSVPLGTENATQWEVTVSWNQFATDTQSQSLVIEENIGGEWMILYQGDHQGGFYENFDASGDALRFMLTAQPGPGVRTVDATVVAFGFA